MKVSQTRDTVMRRKGFVSPTEASQLSRTPVATIYTWIRPRQLPVERIGAGRGRLYIRLADLVKLVGPIMSETA